MIFVSPHPEFLLTGARQPIDHYHPVTGQYQNTTPGIDVQFRHGGAPDWVVEQALENKQFQSLWNGLPDDTDRHLFIGTYDTDKQQSKEGWDDETRREVEGFLLRDVACGIRYIYAEPPEGLRELPWPNYERTHHFAVAQTAKEIGVDIGFVLAYEESHKNRESVVAMLKKELGEEATEEVVAA